MESKKRRHWTLAQEKLLIKLWAERYLQLREIRKNRYMYKEIIDIFEENGFEVTREELRSKLHNLKTRHIKETRLVEKGTPSEWPLYSMVNNVIRRFPNTGNFNEENTNESDSKKNLYDNLRYDGVIEPPSSSNKFSTFRSNNMISDNEDFAICRTCISECTNYKSLYKFGIINGERTTLAALLTYCTNLEFSEEEDSNLSSYICINCIWELSKSYIFKKRVLEADASFRAQLNGNNNNDIENDVMEEEIKEEANDYLEYVVEEPLANLELEYAEDLTNETTTHKDEDIHNINKKHKIESLTDDQNDNDDYDPLELNATNKLSNNNRTKILKKPAIIDFGDESLSKVATTKATAVNKNLLVKSKLPKDLNIECRICSQKFTEMNAYRNHMNLHSNKAPYKCKHCGDSFKTIKAHKEHTAKHIKSHTGDLDGGLIENKQIVKPYSCEVCGKSFITKKMMIIHRENHGGRRKFKCTNCFQSYTKVEYLERHMQTHKNFVSFKCHICSQIFKRETALFIHLRIHENAF